MKRVVASLVVIGAIAAAIPARGQETPELTLDDFEIHQYVASRGLSPVGVMRLDTNDEVLIACRQPRTREELRAMGIDVLESQLVLLRAMSMLRLDGDRFETAIPLLDADATGRLRRATRALAPEIVAEVESEVEAMGRALADRGFGGHLYPVLFSYVLDGMAWDFFEEYKEVLPRRLSVGSPHWAGEVWGTHPPREFAVGTNTIVSGDLRLRISRPPVAGSAIDDLLRGWRDLRSVLRRHTVAAGDADGGETDEIDKAVLERLAAYGVVDDEGAIALPILLEKPGEDVFELAQKVTEKVVAAAREKLALADLTTDLGLRDRRQTLVIAYHELMWDLMDAFEDGGLATRPRLLADPAAAGPADVGAVAFVVERWREPVPPRQDEEVDTGDD